MKISVKFVVIVIVIIALAIVGYSYLPKSEGEEAAGTESTEKTDETEKTENVNYEKLDDVVLDVVVNNIVKGNLVKSIVANGAVKASKEIDYAANVGGIIEKINIFDGKMVSKNEQLLKIEDKEYTLTLKERESSLMQSEADFGIEMKDSKVDSSIVKEVNKQIAALEADYKNKKISKENYDVTKDILHMKAVMSGSKRKDIVMSRSGYLAAQNALERAKMNLQYTDVRAPFSAVVGDFNLVEGQRVNSGVKLFKLLDISKLLINVGVLENDVANIKVGNIVKIKVTAIPDEEFTGRVALINPYIDPENKTCKVTVEMTNKNARIKPGMYAQVKIETSTFKDRIIVPRNAVLTREKRHLIFVVEGNLAKWVYVTLLNENDEFYEVGPETEGQEFDIVGKEVIIKGHYTLTHDAIINVVK